MRSIRARRTASRHVASRLRTGGAALAAVAFLLFSPCVRAQNAAAKNTEGNRLFSQGKYEDAEKSYLQAQAVRPERPEFAYNLGNTLIKQERYEQALQSLQQAIRKGDKGLQINSWYNSGNALFDSGKYQEAAQAYIQALRLNPADQDAKHNLELALKKQEQQQQLDGGKQKENQQKPEDQDQSGNQGKSQPKPRDQQGQPPQSRDQEGNRPAEPQSSSSTRPEGSISRERALQILDALQSQELAEQRKLLERQARIKATGRDW